MSIANFIPEIWSRQLLMTLRKSLIAEGLTNQNYQGEIGGVGDTLHINTPGPITISDYVPRSTEIVYEVPTSTQKTLVIDQDKYFAFSVDDLEEVQSNVNLVLSYTNEASYAMADTLDQWILATGAAGAAHAETLDGTDPANVRSAIIAAGVDLDTANVPKQGRWMTVSPAVAGLFQEAYGDRMTDMGDSVVRAGYVGSAEGFNFYMSNNVADDAGLYGTNMAITIAYDLDMVEAIRLQTAFEDGIRGRLVWGGKVIRPEALGVLTTTFV